jgi:hypothetical protein
MIVLVTGGRYAKPEDHRTTIRYALLWASGAKARPDEKYELWNGGADGADGIAHDLAKDDLGWKPQRFVADWPECDPTWVDPLGKVNSCVTAHRMIRSNNTTYCPTAGFRRNALMISELVKAEGRKVVVGFPIPALGSRGTVDCLTRALHAGLPIVSIPLTSKDAL